MRELTMNEMTAVFGGTEGTWEHRGRVSGERVRSKVGGTLGLFAGTFTGMGGRRIGNRRKACRNCHRRRRRTDG